MPHLGSEGKDARAWVSRDRSGFAVGREGAGRRARRRRHPHRAGSRRALWVGDDEDVGGTRLELAAVADALRAVHETVAMAHQLQRGHVALGTRRGRHGAARALVSAPTRIRCFHVAHAPSFPDCSRPSLLFHSPLPRGAAAGVAASTMPRSTLGGGGVPSPSPVSLSRVATVAESLLAAVSPTFGPHGMSQLLVDDANRLILTDSGHDILEVRPPRTEPRGPEPRGPEPRGPEPRGPEPRGPEPRGPEPRPEHARPERLLRSVRHPPPADALRVAPRGIVPRARRPRARPPHRRRRDGHDGDDRRGSPSRRGTLRRRGRRRRIRRRIAATRGATRSTRARTQASRRTNRPETRARDASTRRDFRPGADSRGRRPSRGRRLSRGLVARGSISRRRSRDDGDGDVRRGESRRREKTHRDHHHPRGQHDPRRSRSATPIEPRRFDATEGRIVGSDGGVDARDAERGGGDARRDGGPIRASRGRASSRRASTRARGCSARTMGRTRARRRVDRRGVERRFRRERS